MDQPTFICLLTLLQMLVFEWVFLATLLFLLLQELLREVQKWYNRAVFTLVFSIMFPSYLDALKDQVCSPGGSTIEGVVALEEHNFRFATIDAITKAYLKNQKLGKWMISLLFRWRTNNSQRKHYKNKKYTRSNEQQKLLFNLSQFIFQLLQFLLLSWFKIVHN